MVKVSLCLPFCCATHLGGGEEREGEGRGRQGRERKRRGGEEKAGEERGEKGRGEEGRRRQGREGRAARIKLCFTLHSHPLSFLATLTLSSSARKLSRVSSVSLPTSNMVTAWFFKPWTSEEWAF